MRSEDGLRVGHTAVADFNRMMKILWSLDLGGKCLLIDFRNVAPMFVATFLLNGGLNHMILRLLLRFLFVGCLSLCTTPSM